MKLEHIKEDAKYKEVFKADQTELKTIEQLAVQDGEIYFPLIVWKGENILVYGYQYLPIVKAHPEIRYSICEMDFADWQEAQVWAIEHYIAQPEVLLAQKLDIAINCGEYWLLKETAKRSQGKRTDLSSDSEGKLDQSNEVNKIIAAKVGCSLTYVYNYRKILSSGRMDIINLCRSGKLTISAAYAKLFTPQKPRTKKPVTSAPIELKITDSDIFSACECHADSGKRTNRIYATPVDPTPVVQKVATTDAPEGCIWIVLHKKQGQMQVVQRNYEKNKGTILAKINAYSCKMIENTDDRIVLEAEHIPASTTETIQKDDRDFSQKPSLAS